MGSNMFHTRAKGKTSEVAFSKAIEDAQYDHGHSGYTGTIAEKRSFVTIKVPDGLSATKYSEQLINESDPRIDDKWGPAGCISLGGEEWLFFGWASS